MNTTEPGNWLERGLILTPIEKLVPPLDKKYDNDEEKVKNLLRVRGRIGGYAPTTQLVRTESGPLQEAIDALQGPSPLKKKKENEESEEEDLDKTQEPQGKTIQEVTLDELEERSETLRIKREAEKAETRITRAQMEKWTKDPKIKDQVLIQL